MHYEERHASAFSETLTRRLAVSDPKALEIVIDKLAKKDFYRDCARKYDMTVEERGPHV